MKSALTFFALFSVVTLTAHDIDSTDVVQHKLIVRADSLMANYQFEKALIILMKCDSLNAGILLRVGQCNFRLGASRAAIRPYERVLRMDSANLTALNQLGQLYARDGDFTDALYSYLRLIELDSTNS